MDAVFYDGTVLSGRGLCAFMNSTDVHPFSVFCKGELSAVAWLGDLKKRSATVHFLAFRTHAVHARHIMRQVCQYWLSMQYGPGEPCFDVLVGMTPENNARAINAARKAGFSYVGTIPHGAYMDKLGKSIGMVVHVMTREGV